MLNQLESNYDCSHASEDLHNLKQELEALTAKNGGQHSADETEALNRLKNQIHFIENKCRIH